MTLKTLSDAKFANGAKVRIKDVYATEVPLLGRKAEVVGRYVTTGNQIHCVLQVEEKGGDSESTRKLCKEFTVTEDALELWDDHKTAVRNAAKIHNRIETAMEKLEDAKRALKEAQDAMEEDPYEDVRTLDSKQLEDIRTALRVLGNNTLPQLLGRWDGIVVARREGK